MFNNNSHPTTRHYYEAFVAPYLKQSISYDLYLQTKKNDHNVAVAIKQSN